MKQTLPCYKNKLEERRGKYVFDACRHGEGLVLKRSPLCSLNLSVIRGTQVLPQ